MREREDEREAYNSLDLSIYITAAFDTINGK